MFPTGSFFASRAPWGFFILALVPLLLLVAVWLVVAGIFVFKGGEVDKPNRMASFYGYTVCLVALGIFLASLSSTLDAMFERAHPLQAETGFGAALTSFDAYRATYRREQAMFDRGAAGRPDTSSQATLRQLYDGLVADRIASVQYRTTKSLTTGFIFLLISLGLFVSHWHWVRRLNGLQAPAA